MANCNCMAEHVGRVLHQLQCGQLKGKGGGGGTSGGKESGNFSATVSSTWSILCSGSVRLGYNLKTVVGVLLKHPGLSGEPTPCQCQHCVSVFQCKYTQPDKEAEAAWWSTRPCLTCK